MEEDRKNATPNWRTSRANPRATSSSSRTTEGGLHASLSSNQEDDAENAKDAAACLACVELLRDAVTGGGTGGNNGAGGPQQSSSKPYQLLQSLLWQQQPHEGGTSSARPTTTSKTPTPLVVQLTPEGLQVQIPAEDPLIPKRRWSRLPSETPISTPSPTVVVQRLATSARSATTAAAPETPSSTSSSHQQHKPLEWLQLSCRKCSETGPEGGARAFVMGPHPLSVVVCHNRLQHLPPPPQSQKVPSPLALSAAWSSSTRNNRDNNQHQHQHQLQQQQQQQQQQQLQQQRQQQLHEMDEILTHELTHVYDVRRLHLDLRDCENLAYSEVRAARAAECAVPAAPLHQPQTKAAPWYYYGPAASRSMRAQRSCVQHKAVTATHNLFPQHAAACLSKVFDKAWADQRPWNRNSNGGVTGSGGGPLPPVPPQASSSR